MKAVLLAAGLGTRLGPLTETTPKILVTVDGIKLLDRQLAYLSSQGVTDVAVNAHHHWEQVVSAIGEWGSEDFRVQVWREENLLGTAGALIPMRDWIGGEPFFVLYGDVLTNLELRPMMEAHIEAGSTATVACYIGGTSRKGEVLVFPRGLSAENPLARIVAFTEKPEHGRIGLVNAGVYVIHPGVIRMIDEGDDFGFNVFPYLLSQGHDVASYIIDPAAIVVDCGTPESLDYATQLAKEGKLCL